MEARAEKQRQARLRADMKWRKQQRQRELERNQVSLRMDPNLRITSRPVRALI